MYSFKIENDMNKHDDFVTKNDGLYIQSSRWANVKTTWKCTYYAGYHEEKQVLAVVVMERKLPGAGKIWYTAGGPVCNYNNFELIKEFTDFIKGEMKKKGATMLAIDPSVSHRIDNEIQFDSKDLHRALTKFGYVLNANIDNYTYKQPTEFLVKLTQDGEKQTADKILKKCDKGVRYSIRIGQQRGLVEKTCTIADIEKDPSLMDDFMAIMKDTSKRDNFVGRSGDYCTKIMREMGEFCDLKLVYYDKNLDKKLQAERLAKKAQAVAQLETAHEKKARQLNETISSVDKQTEHYEKRMQEANEFSSEDKICVAGGLSIYYAGTGSCLFGGTRDVIRNNTRSSHYLNYLRLCESINRGCKFHDLGAVNLAEVTKEEDGMLAPLVPRDDFKGIYDFKKSFGANFHEYVGEYILVSKKPQYLIYSKLMPLAKSAKLKMIKLIRK